MKIIRLQTTPYRKPGYGIFVITAETVFGIKYENYKIIL
jgi:hypothetical protein